MDSQSSPRFPDRPIADNSAQGDEYGPILHVGSQVRFLPEAIGRGAEMGMPVPVAIHSAEDVVNALDLRRIEVGGQCWVIEVLGVHRIGADLWVQIACKCRPSDSLIVRIAPETTADDVLHALTWTEPTPQFPRVISVASAPTYVVH